MSEISETLEIVFDIKAALESKEKCACNGKLKFLFISEQKKRI